MLSPETVKLRMVEWRNLKTLHAKAILQNTRLRKENKLLRERISVLESTVSAQASVISDLKLQMEELKTIVFGKKNRGNNTDIDEDTPPQAPLIRKPESYKRKVPEESEVTDRRNHPIDACNHCHGAFSEQETVTYFEEDIPLPQRKAVIKHTVLRGYCESCKRWSVEDPVPAAHVILGPYVKRYVTYLSVVGRQSYRQIQDILLHTHDFSISEGEIAKIQRNEGERFRPEYERLKSDIRKEPSIHFDETGWPLNQGDGIKRFAWTMVGGQSSSAVFELGKTRGKGNRERLLEHSKSVVVSDDYGAYRKMDNPHQLCLAHILRKLRDLATSTIVLGEVREHCIDAYKVFASIYRDIEHARASNTPQGARGDLLLRLKTFALSHASDPLKLSRVKGQIGARTENYLTCLMHPHVASDNNAAERSLRHLVIKRKTSFGSFSERTADTLAILLSVLLSYRQKGMLRNYLLGV